jgi:hypothetical protein
LRDSVNSPDPIGSYSFSDLSLSFGAAVEIMDGTFVGLTGRYFNERLWRYSGHTWGFDAGLYYSPAPWIGLGLSILDLGFDTHLDGQGFKPPMTMRIGSTFNHVFSETIAGSMSLDFLYRPYEKQPGIRTGIEMKLFELLALRVGAKMLYQNEDDKIELLPPSEFLTFGLGIDHKGIGIDYAMAPYQQNLGLTHRISLNLSFE